MRHLMQNSSVKALLLVGVGLGFSACMAEGSPPHIQSNDMSRFSSTRYMPSYQAQTRTQIRIAPPYVLIAQNNAVPQLRGMLSNPQRVQRQYYQDYQSETHNYYAPAKPQSQNVITRRSFSHQLDEAVITPQRHYATQSNAKPYYQYQEPLRPRERVEQSSAAPIYYEQPETETTYVSDTSFQETAPQDTASPDRPKTNVKSVNQSVSRARSQSPRLAIEDLKIQEAEEGLVQAKAQGRFRLSLDSNVGVSQSETDFTVINRTDSDTRLQRAASLDLSLPLYQGGRIKAQKNVAKVGIKAAQANYDVVENAVTQETAIAHLNVIRDRDLIQIYARNVDLLKDQKQTVQALVRAGENTVTDEALIDARLASIQVRLEQAKASLAASESNYKKLVGRPAPPLKPVGAVELPDSLQQIKDAAQINNAQVKAVETQAEAAFHNIAVVKSFGRPKLSLQGVLRAAEGQSETIRRNSAAEVLLNLNVPLLSGGENKSRVRQAALAQSRAVLETRALHNNLNERLEQLWASVQSARRSKVPNQAQKIAAQKAYEAINKQRNAGLATSLDVLSVEQTLLDAEINLLQAQNTEDVSRFQLLGLMGAL